MKQMKQIDLTDERYWTFNVNQMFDQTTDENLDERKKV